MTEQRPMTGAPIGAPDPFDPVALERRLVEARRRRAVALAAREKARKPTAAPALPALRKRLAWPSARLPTDRMRLPTGWTRRADRLMLAMFFCGAALGGAFALHAPTAWRQIAPQLPPAPYDRAVGIDSAPGAPAAVAAPAAPRLPEPPTTVAFAPPEAGAAPPPPAGALAGLRIVVHLPPSVPAAEAAGLVAALQAAGPAELRQGRAGVSIRASNVRYFHQADRAAAEAVAAIASAAGAPTLARDFTDFSPTPPPGAVELWLAGEAPARPSAPAAAGWEIVAGRVADTSLSRAQSVLEQVLARLPDATAGRSDRGPRAGAPAAAGATAGAVRSRAAAPDPGPATGATGRAAGLAGSPGRPAGPGEEPGATTRDAKPSGRSGAGGKAAGRSNGKGNGAGGSNGKGRGAGGSNGKSKGHDKGGSNGKGRR